MTVDLARVGWLLERAAELDPVGRERFLQRACGDDPGLRTEVESLLATERSVGSPPEDGAPDPAAIGPYRLLREIGSGGSSDVYLAERADEEFRRRVAIKILRAGFLDAESHRRFLFERQVLARLDHPNIARLYDSGTSADGRPYVVLELIEGEPLDAYCDRLRLAVRERVELLLEVCAAVESAHRNLVVHRDLKPSNILVTADGVPKLLDFGIAKALRAELAPPGLEPTVVWRRVLTPEYASPEQAAGGPITTASDVYSLGVVLHVLLTGRPPLELAGREPAEVERLLQDAERPAPSRTLSELPADRAEAMAAARSSRAGELRATLAGDLDAVVGKGLRIEPEHRYGSVAELAADLRRWLDDEPISARPAGWSSHLRRLIRRNRLAAVLGGLLVSTLAVLLASSSWQASRLGDERDRARSTASFLQELIAAANPNATGGGASSLRAVLDRGLERLGEGDEGFRRAVRAELLHTLADGYAGLGELATAERLHLEALDLRRADSELSLDTAANLDSLGAVVARRGDLYRSEELLRRSLAIRRALLPVDDVRVADSLNSLATVLNDRSESASAEPLLREALAILDAQGGEPDGLAQVLNNLGFLYETRGDLERSADYLRRALEVKRRQLGDRHPSVAIGLDNLGVTLRRLGRPEEAEGLARQALELRRELLGKDHPDVSNSLDNLAAALRDQGRLDEAGELMREALSLRRLGLGEEHPDVAISLNNLGHLRLLQGRLAESEDLHRRSLAIRQAAFGDEHPEVARSLHNLGVTLERRGRLGEAEAYLGRALDLRRRADANGGLAVGYTLSALGRLHLAQGRREEATAELREALALLAAKLPASNRRVVEVEAALAEAIASPG